MGAPSKRLSPEQARYALALAAYEATLPAARAREAEFDAWYDAQTAGMDDAQEAAWLAALSVGEAHPALVARENARKALVAAEEAMLDWAERVTAPVATPAQREAMAQVRASRVVTVRAKVIDLAFRLAA